MWFVWLRIQWWLHRIGRRQFLGTILPLLIFKISNKWNSNHTYFHPSDSVVMLAGAQA